MRRGQVTIPDLCPTMTALVAAHCNQCCGSGSESGSTGSICFWASWIRIRILLTLSKYRKNNLDFYCFVTSF